MQLILDIETKPNKDLEEIYMENIKAPRTYKDPEKIAAYIEEAKIDARKKMAVDTDFASIFCIGVKELDGNAYVFSLQEFSDYLKELTKKGTGRYLELITFNGKKFDIPVIIKNGLRQGIDLPYQELRNMCQRFKTDRHHDLIEILSDYEFKSLDTYLQIYLGIKKKEIDFETCTDEELRAHCLEDICNTERLYNMFKVML